MTAPLTSVAIPDNSQENLPENPPKNFPAHPHLPLWQIITIWTLRILLGGTFILSGFVKMIDPWGFIFKLEEYLGVWGIVQPRTILLMGALLISGYEFVMGALLAMGCYKRVAAWGLTLMMAVMLPLTAYIWFADPVSDCGCFGEFFILSNAATFWKNVAITAGLVYLCICNSRLKMAFFNPEIQWIVGGILSLYILLIGLYGYNIVPMLDFRSYPVDGTPLINIQTADGAEEEADDADYRFLYSKDGVTRSFPIDSLPDDSWEFIDRIAPSDIPSELSSNFAIFNEDEENVTDEVISPEGSQLLLIIPELQRADLSFTYTVNELYEYADSVGIPMIAIIGTDARGLHRWEDTAMAEYPCYSADDTMLKELSRGYMSVVTLSNAVPVAKVTISSVNPDIIDSPTSTNQLLDELNPHPKRILGWLNLVFGGSLLALYLCQGVILAIRTKIKKKYRANTAKK